MTTVFLILLIIHACLHLLGFLKAYDLAELKELSLPISRSRGFLWLLCTILFLAYAASYYLQIRFSWIPGLAAVMLSQILIINSWADAKFGTLPNLIILVVVLISIGYAL